MKPNSIYSTLNVATLHIQIKLKYKSNIQTKYINVTNADMHLTPPSKTTHLCESWPWAGVGLVAGSMAGDATIGPLREVFHPEWLLSDCCHGYLRVGVLGESISWVVCDDVIYLVWSLSCAASSLLPTALTSSAISLPSPVAAVILMQHTQRSGVIHSPHARDRTAPPPQGQARGEETREPQAHQFTWQPHKGTLTQCIYR